MKRMLVVALGLAIIACGGSGEEEEDEEALPEVDCAAGAIPTYADLEGGVLTKCVICHDSAKSGAARQEAPATVNFDTQEAATDEATEAAHEVFEGAMPPADAQIPLSQAEKDALYLWALCGTP